MSQHSIHYILHKPTSGGTRQGAPGLAEESEEAPMPMPQSERAIYVAKNNLNLIIELVIGVVTFLQEWA